MPNDATSHPRGRDAVKPTGIPKPGWRDILLRVKNEIADDHVSVVAAGVAFFGLLAVFPAVAAFMSIAGLVLDPASVEAQLSGVAAALPENAASIVQEQAAKVAASDDTSIGLAALTGIAFSLYSASRGMNTLIEGMNIAYGEDEKRGFFMKILVSLTLTLLMIVGILVALGATVVAAALLGKLGLSDLIATLVDLGRWPLLAVLTMLGLAVIYRYGPSRENAEWRWVSVGSVVATAIWMIGSAGFSLYVSNFGNYNETYGALGGVIILLTWLWLSAFVILLGAKLNAEIEHQTARDTTTGEPEPRGERGAVVADTVGVKP